jgi:GNAT superfamily N-acetyltransferase
MDDGELLVARRGEQLLGHIQSIPIGRDWEIKSLAVIESEQGHGIGTSLIRAALHAAWCCGANRVLLATATADIQNLRFYQRLGFRMDRVERDAFTAERGYPSTEADGIPILDRVWLSIDAPRR